MGGLGGLHLCFVGPDGLIYKLQPAHQEPVNQLRLFYIQLSSQFGYSTADAGERLPVRTQSANLETLDPPLFGGRIQLWEFESETAPSEADHGENIILAHFDPSGRGITGPLGGSTGRPRTTLGAQPGGPRVGVKQGRARSVSRWIPQAIKDRWARGRRNERRVLE